jgi:uncharacterized protein YkwD
VTAQPTTAGRRGAALLAAVLLSWGGASLADVPAGDDLASWRGQLLDALVERRAELGLTALTRSDALDRAAQEHADEMASGGWFAFSSPSGTSVEDRVEAAGFGAELVAAKLYRAPLLEASADLVTRWWQEIESSRQSLFHAGVREAGVGVATTGSERYFVFVLASRPLPGSLPPSLGADLGARRAAFLAAANALRAEHGVGSLRADAALERATQEHATALLAALKAGRPAITVADLASRLSSGLGSPGIMAVGKANAGGSAGYSQKTPGREGSKVGSAALAQAVVVDAMSASQAVATAVAASAGDLIAPGYTKLGVGVAVDMAGEAPHVVWVAALTRR